ncbi:uncharacterized protein LTHEOB_8076 [Lasiodiplodia theobromae]|uniref:uncharacterized protein n=1 Tax=Lasiodiplodia theobromae TaxID=45133 RepID=UPI0015C2C4AC|nr:uncharacterized protein LTHEOB_8076 [Lasiodiplodia theobromae]KAF4541922.1 hypothetical protein LTHEOB_8076 [Lasiodiplodia theobromae]
MSTTKTATTTLTRLRASTLITVIAPSARPITRHASARSFSAGPRLLLKEDALHHERSGEEAEAAKQAQIQKQRDGKGHWHEELASNSEVNVKADQEAGGVADHGRHMQELQILGKEKGERGEL